MVTAAVTAKVNGVLQRPARRLAPLSTVQPRASRVSQGYKQGLRQERAPASSDPVLQYLSGHFQPDAFDPAVYLYSRAVNSDEEDTQGRGAPSLFERGLCLLDLVAWVLWGLCCFDFPSGDTRREGTDFSHPRGGASPLMVSLCHGEAVWRTSSGAP
ncbi:unnamed protein product [Boreogadus saida]